MAKRQASQRARKVHHASALQTKTWIDRELAGSEFRGVRLHVAIYKTFGAVLPWHRREHSFGLPGLDRYISGASLFLVRTCADRLAGGGKRAKYP
jgi:hypothetical protein